MQLWANRHHSRVTSSAKNYQTFHTYRLPCHMDPSITSDVDLYGLLSVDSTASEKEIRRAYRKIALIHHPDKNPSKDAAEKFHLISLALDTLTDGSKKAQYDALREAKLAQLKRTQELSAARRKLKEDLEQREAQAGVKASEAFQQKRKLDSLKQEGLEKKRVFQEKKLKKMEPDGLNNQETNSENLEPWRSGSKSVKIKWKQLLEKPFNEEDIRNAMMFFGHVDFIVLKRSNKKSQSGIVTFTTALAAKKAVESDLSKATQPFLRSLKGIELVRSELSSTEDTTTESKSSSSIKSSMAEKLAQMRSRLNQDSLKM